MTLEAQGRKACVSIGQVSAMHAIHAEVFEGAVNAKSRDSRYLLCARPYTVGSEC